MKRKSKTPKRQPRPQPTPSQDDDATPTFRFAGLEEVLGYHVRRAHGAVRRTYKAELASLQMTQKQTAVMWLIEQNPGIAQVTIGQALGMDRATTTALIDRLQGRGLVTRLQSKVDGRRWALSATAEGKRLMAQVRKRVARHEERLVSLFSPAELKLFRELLDRLESLDRNAELDFD